MCCKSFMESSRSEEMFLPSVHFEWHASQSITGCALSAWILSLLHTGLLAGLSCTATPLLLDCKGQLHSRSAPCHHLSSDPLLLTQTRCSASFPVHLKNISVESVDATLSSAQLDVWNSLLPCWFLKGQNSLRSGFLFHQTYKQKIFNISPHNVQMSFSCHSELKDQLPGSTGMVQQCLLE